MTQMFTTGYERITASSFVVKLLDQSINALIDIRQNPFSRKPGFSAKALRANLHNVGIEYLHFQELGTPKPLRDFLAHNKDYPSFFDMYRQYLP